MINERLILVSAIFILGLIFSKNQVYGQSYVDIDGSQVISNFKFENSDGKEDKDYSSNISGAYSLGYTYIFPFNLMIDGYLGMRKSGANLIVDNANYSWELQYADVKICAGYIYQALKFKPYFKISGYYGQLLSANQRINDRNINIIDLGEIKESDYGLIITPGVRYNASDYISLYSEVGYLMGLKNIETANNAQKTLNRAVILSLGLSFSIIKPKSSNE